MPAAVWRSWKNSEISAVTARAITRDAEFDHVDLETLGPRGGGEFQPDEARTDHHDTLRRKRSAAATPRSRRGSAGNARLADWRWECRAGGCARRWRAPDAPYSSDGAGCEQQPARRAIDGDGAIADQLDVLVAIKLVRPEHQAVRTAFALQIGLGQRRPLIRQMRLIVDQADALAIAMLPQRRRELKTRMAGADDQNCSLRHWVRPARCEAARCRARASVLFSRGSGLPVSSNDATRLANAPKIASLSSRATACPTQP